MTDPRPPDLPGGLPPELADFITCKSAAVRVATGAVGWSPVPGVTLDPGPGPDRATFRADLGITTVELPVTVSDGRLSVDSSAIPEMLGGARQTIDDWVRQLNDWFASQGQRFGRPVFGDGFVRLVKEPIPPAAPPPPPAPERPPQPPAAGSQPPPPPPAQDGDGCLKWLGIGLLVAAMGLVGAVALNSFAGQPRPSSPPTGPPSGSGTASAPTATGQTASSPGRPTAPPTERPTQAPTDPATQPPTQAPTDPPAATFAERAPGVLETVSRGLLALPAEASLLEDATGDLFTIVGGPGPATDVQPWVDLIGAAGYLLDLEADTAADLSAAFPCAETVTPGPVMVACNQSGPLLAEEHVVILLNWSAPPPDPFPSDRQCSWSIQTNVDDDPATGFPDPPPGHPLAGADVYHEMLTFQSQGQLRNYNLATDYARPARPDTGELQGNLSTVSRTLVYVAPDGPTAGESLWTLFIVPRDDFGDNYSAHAFCWDPTKPGTLAIDAVGRPEDNPFPMYAELMPEFP